MEPEFKIVWILAIGISCAGILGYLANRFKLSPILGYLLAGYLIGPYSPGFVADVSVAAQLAYIGVTLLMFVVGLHFNWKDLMIVKKIALPGAFFLAILSILFGFLLSISLGESAKAGLIIGGAVCVSSTVVIVKMLTDQDLLHTIQGHIAIGWTIVEDLIAVFILILMPSFVLQDVSVGQGITTQVLYSIGFIVLKIIGLAVFVFFIADRLVQALLKHVARTQSHELFTLCILSVVFLIAIGSAYFVGVSLALGAFIAGVSVGKTNVSQQAAANALPMRDTFAVIFFLSIGMLFNPLSLTENLPLFFGTLFIALVLRFCLAFFTVRLFKYPFEVALIVGVSISQIGEYSFILIEEGNRLNILPDNAYDIIVACSLITISLNPIFFQINKILKKKKDSSTFVKTQSLDTESFKAEESEAIKPTAMVMGFGAIGQAAVECLKDNGYHTLIIDRDIDKIEQLKQLNFEAFFGDAAQFQLLEIAGLENIQFIVITIPDFKITKKIINNIEQLNPYAKIIARLRNKEDLEHFKDTDIPIVCDEDSTTKDMKNVILENMKSLG